LSADSTDSPTTDISTLSLHDALPILCKQVVIDELLVDICNLDRVRPELRFVGERTLVVAEADVPARLHDDARNSNHVLGRDRVFSDIGNGLTTGKNSDWPSTTDRLHL